MQRELNSHAIVAQLVARLFWGQDVAGSSPATPTICWIGEIGSRCGFKPRCHKGVRVQIPHPAPHAGLVEQVDTADSKSVASKHAGSSPVADTKTLLRDVHA